MHFTAEAADIPHQGLRGQCVCCTGEYWVVGVDTEQYDPANPEKYLKALLRDETNPVAQRAFRSYLGVVPSPPVGFENFTEQVNYYMEKPPFSFPNPLIYFGAYKTVSAQLVLRYGLSEKRGISSF